MNLKVWEVHSQACKLTHAEKTCMGTANKAGVQWCGPYVNANQTGFWLHSPINIDFKLKNGNFEIVYMDDYSSEDYNNVANLVRPEDNCEFQKWIFPGSGRTKTTFGFVEPNVIQIWTGLIFQTPPGWCLHIKSPINFPYMGYNIVEAILETDWLQYDIWMNVSVTHSDSVLSIKKEIPLAHLVPMRRESFKGEWGLERESINRDTPEAEKVFKYWINYNKQKFEFGGKQALSENLTKDSTTYFKEKARLIGKEMEPLVNAPKNESKCPFAHLHETKKQVPEYSPLVNSFVFNRFEKQN